MGLLANFGGSAGAATAAPPSTEWRWPTTQGVITVPIPGILADQVVIPAATPPTAANVNGDATQPGGAGPMGTMPRYNFPADGNVNPNTTVGYRVLPGLVSYRAASRIGGFTARIFFGFGANSPAALLGKRLFVGIVVPNSALLTSNPSALPNIIGIGRDSADTALHFMSRGTGAAFKQVLGGTGFEGDQNILYQLDIANTDENVYTMNLTRVTTTLVIPPAEISIPLANIPSFAPAPNGTNPGQVAYSQNPLATVPISNLIIGPCYGTKFIGQTV